ncbi:MAG: hypothetical protein ACK53I_03215 [Phenylobacterium sp.]
MILRGLLAILAATALLGGSASAQTRADLIPLGQSAASGAVCQAVRDYDDPVAQGAGRRAWNIRCRGWEGNLGRLYTLPTTDAVQAWEGALAGRVDCQTAKGETLAGLGDANRRACRNRSGQAPYLAYDARRGSNLFVAEGAAQLADVLETG